MLGANLIPTKEEQADLLANVQEVFNHVKILVNEETNSTDDSVISDIERVCERAKTTLDLHQELALTKLSCTANSVCMLDYKAKIAKLCQEGVSMLKSCSSKSSQDTRYNSEQLRNITKNATARGEDLLNTLYKCSRKPGLQVINCYKEVIAHDVSPVKIVLLEMISRHKWAHNRAIDIRKEASKCTDDIVDEFSKKIRLELEAAIKC